MSFHYGQATDYLDLLTKLVAFANQDSITAAAVNAGGTGYAVDDILTVAGGTATLTAQIRVTTVSSGVITGVRVENAGSYTARPTLTANAVTGGGGSGATIDLTITNGLVEVAVNAGGTGYVVGDILSVAGGTSTVTATVEVTSVASGVIDGVEVKATGTYTVDPTLTANSVTGGTGSGATMNLTMATNGWGVKLNQVYDTTERETIFRGVGSGEDGIFVGIRTYRDAGPDIFNWELAGFTGYAATDFDLQAGISPGRHDASVPLDDGGAFLPLDDDTIDYWFNVNGRRMIIVAKPTAGSGYHQAYLGFHDPFATDAELPYPILIAGSTGQRVTRFNSTRMGLGGLSDPIPKSKNIGIANGPMMFRFTDGVWYTVANRSETFNAGVDSTTSNRQASFGMLTPPGHPLSSIPSGSDPNLAVLDNENLHQWNTIFPMGATTQQLSMRSTPNTPNDDVPLFPMTLLTPPGHVEIPRQIIGQINDVLWCPVGGSSVVSEDFVTKGADIYQAFQNANKTGENDYVAIKIN